MKKLISLIIFALSVSAPSFAAVHVISHSAEVVGKSTYHVVKPPAKAVGKGSAAVVRFIF